MGRFLIIIIALPLCGFSLVDLSNVESMPSDCNISGNKVKYEACLEHYIQKAEKGDALAQYQAGKLWLRGAIDNKKDKRYLTNAIKWLHKATQSDEAKAIQYSSRLLQSVFENGLYGVEKNFDVAKCWHDVSQENILAKICAHKSYALLNKSEQEENNITSDYTRCFIQVFDDNIARDRENAHAYYMRGVINEKFAEYGKAILDYNKAISIDSDKAEIYYRRGLILYFRQEYNQAISDYTKHLELGGRIPDVYLKRGMAFHKLGKKESAIQDYTKALEKDPQNSQARFLRGELKCEASDLKAEEQDWCLDEAAKANEAILDFMTHGTGHLQLKLRQQ